MNATSRRLNRKGLVAAIAGIGMMFGLSSAAQAEFVLTLEDLTAGGGGVLAEGTSGTGVYATDSGAPLALAGYSQVGDLNAAPSALSYISFVQGLVGGFNVITTSTTGATTGGMTQLLFLDNTVVTGTGTFQLRLSATDLTAAAATMFLNAGASMSGGSADSTVEFEAYVDAENTLLAETTQIGSTLSLTTLADSGKTSESVGVDTEAVPDGLFSATIVMTLSQSGSVSFASDGVIIRAPEPAIVGLLGMGLIAVQFARRRRSDKA